MALLYLLNEVCFKYLKYEFLPSVPLHSPSTLYLSVPDFFTHNTPATVKNAMSSNFPLNSNFQLLPGDKSQLIFLGDIYYESGILYFLPL